MTAFQKFDPYTFLKRERRAPDRAPTFATFATFAGRPPKSGIYGTASEALSHCDTGAAAAKGIEIQIGHAAVEHDRKNQNLTPAPAKVAKVAKDDKDFRNFRSPSSVFDGGALSASWEEARRDRLEERAAILEVDGGLPRTEAEAFADRDTREAERDASPYAPALAELRGKCPTHVPEDRWRQAITDATAFATEWGGEARTFGWTEAELFGLHPVPEQPAPNYDRLARLDDMGLIWLLRGRLVVALTATEAAYRCPSDAILTYRRERRA
jgi:hypothetical protein